MMTDQKSKVEMPLNPDPMHKMPFVKLELSKQSSQPFSSSLSFPP